MIQQLEALAINGVASAIGSAPAPIARGAARALGASFLRLDRAHRRIAEENVAAAFPGRSPAEHHAIVAAAFDHFGQLLFEIIRFSRLSRADMLARVDFKGGEHVRQAYAEHRGVLFVTGHFGFWELQALVHALEFEPMAVLARPLDNPALHAMLEAIRTSTGNSVIYRPGTIRRVLRTLQDGHGVGILIDQHILGRDAITIDFFNRPAATTPLVGAMAARTGAPVVPLFALPLGGGRYQMVYEPPIAPPASESPDDIRAFTQRCTDVLEMYVRKYPQLWLWMHRRWRIER
jgi:KDO2-lipid IV(A) lauroyltransferase